MEKLMHKAVLKENLNESYLEFHNSDDFRDACLTLYRERHSMLRLLFAADEREIDGRFRIYAVFSKKGEDRFIIPVLPLEDRGSALSYPALTHFIPAAHWYEREIRDMFGIEPLKHPDPRPLVFHGMVPEGVYPLRRDVSVDALKALIDQSLPDRYEYMKVDGEGVYEIPVGPVHAGIIEPGHFRFSAVGETIFFLEPRLFYTHKGTEKHFETLGFSRGVPLSERISGVSSFSHSAAYCMAVERMSGTGIPEKAAAARTILLELERLYNHIGDIGNMCAGTGFAVGYAQGATLKEQLMRLNERISGSRYLRGINEIGGIKKDVFENTDDILLTLDKIKKEFLGYRGFLLKTVSHLERLENAGRLSGEIALKLGATGPAARASGINDDIRISHPVFLYDRVILESRTHAAGDVLARMMVRAEEVECSISIINELLETPYSGPVNTIPEETPSEGQALGYVEGPRGSIFYWVKSGKAGEVLRVKVRSASFCNWPLMPFAVHGNIIPDFPLCNKSFNLSYSGCDM